jgi:hypothetical protein
VAVIILYVFILTGWGGSSVTSFPSCPAIFASVFREAPKLFAKVNKEWLPKVGAWIDVALRRRAAGRRR